MKTQEKKFDLAVFKTPLAPVDLVGPRVGGHIVCTTRRKVTMDRVSPQVSRYEERMRNRRQRQIEREQRKARKQAKVEIRSTPQPYD